MSRTPRLDAVAATSEGTWVRHALVDLAGDLVAGVLLSQIAYWSGWDRKGLDRLTVQREGHRWLAKSYASWWDECRVTEDQARRAVKVLVDRGLVKTHVWKFNGTPMVHLRLVPEAMEEAMATWDVPESIRVDAQNDSGGGPDGSGSGPGSFPHTPETTSGTTPDPSSTDDPRADPMYGFDRFWDRYPKRNGKRLGKKKAAEKWRRLSVEKKAQAWRAVQHYARACDQGLTIARDPERFLSNDWFEDWAEGPASPRTADRGTRPEPTALGTLAEVARREAS